ncbi:MAG: glycosyltransferase [bacterium]|nr:glycosyltransferase [bacterium]
MPQKKRILIVMSDTGGGHRAAAEAIRAALLEKHPDEAEIVLVDGFRAAGFPYKYAPELYPWWINNTRTSWEIGYKLLDTPVRARLATQGIYFTAQNGLKKMFRANPADMIVCVHSVLTQVSLQALMRYENRPPFVVVVTDLASTHHFWYDRRAERTLVPSQDAYEIALEAGMKPEKVRITGLPVHPQFARSLDDRTAIRRELGWNLDLPTFLLVGGGDGMGPLYKTARAINEKGLKCQVVIVAGRNKALKEKLEAVQWNQPTHIYGYVTTMPRLMAAANVLITKAGPATISEAFIAHLPMILYDAIPGQETGNVELVVKNKAGIYAPGPSLVADTAESWLKEGPDGLKRRAEAAARLAKPNAVWDIADEIWTHAQTPFVRNRRRRRAALLKQIAPTVKIPKMKIRLLD